MAVASLVAVTSSAYADDVRTVYVDASQGQDSNSGESASTAFKTLDRAIQKIGQDDGTVVFVSNYMQNSDYTEPPHSGAIVLTSDDGIQDYGAALSFPGSSQKVYRLSGPTEFRNLKIVTTGWTVFAAQFHPIVFGEGISALSTVSNATRQIYVVGGYEAPDSNSLALDLDSHITINSGTFHAVGGFTRTKGIATQTYTGTSHITVNGGDISTLYGASLNNHYSGSTVIRVTGGTIGKLNAGGDVTRRLDGSADITLLGGMIGTIDVNNVVGNATLTLDGVTYSDVMVTYASQAIQDLAIKAGSEKIAKYNALLYSGTQIAQLESVFDKTENFTNVYVSEGASGTGCTVQEPCGSMRDAYELLRVAGGVIRVRGAVPWDFASVVPQANGKVTFTRDEAGNIVFPRDAFVRFASDVTFENIELRHEDHVTLHADGSRLVIGDGVVTDDAAGLTVSGGAGGSLAIYSGSFERVIGAAGLDDAYAGTVVTAVYGGTIGQLWSGTTDAYAVARAETSIFGGNIDTIYSSVGHITDAYVLRLYGGRVDSVMLDKLDRDVLLRLADAEVNQIYASGWGQQEATRTLIYTPADAAVVAGVATLFENKITHRFVYLEDGGTGDGSHPGNPVGDLNEAIALLGGDGHVVISGKYTISSAYKVEAHAYPVTLTSYDYDQDYRTSGAVFELGSDLLLGGETFIEKLQFNAPSFAVIFGMGHPLTIGEDVDTTLTLGNKTYINIIGGHNRTTVTPNIRLEVNSGNWEVLRGGSNYKGAQANNLNIDMTVNGGTFHGYVAAAPRDRSLGNVKVTVNGGIFEQGLFVVHEYVEDTIADNGSYDVELSINGGEFWKMIGPARNKTTRLNGTFHVNLNGGDFSHLTDFRGTEGYEGNMTSFLAVGPDIDIHAEPEGTITFTNYLRGGADPYMFYYNGFYYYTSTASKSIVLHKVANIADLKTSTGYTVLRPTYGQNLWSPEIHYFSAAEVGAEQAGWYMFLSFDDGTTSIQRQHVVKALDGDNLLGPWGNPLTGEVNVPLKLINEDNPDFNNEVFVSGTSVARIDGKTYLTYVSDVGKGTSDFHQTINMSKFKNPWTLVGEPSVLVVPEYEWEMGGYAQSSTDPNFWYPKVVEGSGVVYGENGEVYMVYTGSGYWTVHYALGYMKFLGGDPMVASNWVKNPTPILSRSSTINGSGHGSYFTDADGTKWVAYHAYVGTDTSSGRFAFVEPYHVDENEVVIGNGSGHPAPLETEYTVPVNRTPLSEKLSGFGNAAPAMTSISLNGVVSPVKAGTINQTVVTATYNNGTTVDVTAGALFASSDPSVADITATGLAIYKKAGTTVLTATYGGLAANSVTVQVYGTTNSTAKPGALVVTDNNGYDNGLMDGNYDISMNMWYGENGWLYRLYENEVLIDTQVLADVAPSAQMAVTAIRGKPNGTYRYRAELMNAFGTTSSQTHVVTVADAAPGKPVLAHNNWDGDGSFQVSMNLWWGTNGVTYRLYENDVLIDTQILTNHTPSVQSAVTTITNRGSGMYQYRAELANEAGVTSSDKLIVSVNK
jgi:GH43 family beta-xylosidase